MLVTFFLLVSEEKFLHQLHLEEQFGASSRTGFVAPPIEGKKKVPGAAIGYVYEDSNASGSNQGSNISDIALPPPPPGTDDSESILPQVEGEGDEDDEEDDDDDSDLDFGKYPYIFPHKFKK